MKPGRFALITTVGATIAFALACGPPEQVDEEDTGTRIIDNDGDGVAEADDCDDNDENLGAVADDADCDGTQTDEDCDDNDDTIYPGAPEIWDDGIDQDCDGVADVEGAACSADLTVSFPDGSSTTLDGCTDWDFDASFEYDPDDAPEVIDFTFTLGATTETDFDCRIELVQQGVCGTGYYDHQEVSGTTTMVLMDCSGVADEYEDTFDGSRGYLRIDTIDAGSTPGSFAGEPLATTLEAHLHVWTDGGIDLEGDLALTLVQVANDGEEQTDCVVTNGDEDGDGYIHTYFDEDDCDDEDALTFPGAAENEDASACMTDADSDGWGDDSPYIEVDAGTDCDDNDATAYPGVADAEPSLCTHDADGDGYGDEAATSPLDAGTDCNDSAAELNQDDADGDGYSTCEDDCDDDEVTTYPGALELTGDGVDSDCDGGEICFLDTDDDGHRPDSTSTVVSVDDDCLDTSEATTSDGTNDCDDADDDTYPGAAESDSTTACMTDWDGDGWGEAAPATGVDVGTDCDDADSALTPEDADGDGFSTCDDDCDDDDATLNPVDIDRDGYSTCDNDCDDSDRALSPGGDDGLFEDYTCDGLVNASLLLSDYTFVSEEHYDYAGWSVSAAGDVDGDGLDDILVSAYGNDDGGSAAGKIYLILGASLGFASEIDLSLADYSFVGEYDYDYAGHSISAAGDVDGDGLDDILVGAYLNDDGGSAAGKTYLILGASLGSTSSLSLLHADYSFLGENTDDYAGYSVSGAGDVDGDGLDDILVGAYNYDDRAGKTYLILGSSLGSTSSLALFNADYSFVGENSYDYSSMPVSSAGDVDNDGLGDIFIGAHGNDEGGTYAGKTYLILGSSLGSAAEIDLSLAEYSFVGLDDYGRSGWSVSSAGDMNGDGLDDILIGAYFNADGGHAYLIFSGL